jgi:hypothetical protein
MGLAGWRSNISNSILSPRAAAAESLHQPARSAIEDTHLPAVNDPLIRSMVDLLDRQIRRIEREPPGLHVFWAKFTAKVDVIFDWADPEPLTEVSTAITELFAHHELVYPADYFRDAGSACPYFSSFQASLTLARSDGTRQRNRFFRD